MAVGGGVLAKWACGVCGSGGNSGANKYCGKCGNLGVPMASRPRPPQGVWENRQRQWYEQNKAVQRRAQQSERDAEWKLVQSKKATRDAKKLRVKEAKEARAAAAAAAADGSLGSSPPKPHEALKKLEEMEAMLGADACLPARQKIERMQQEKAESLPKSVIYSRKEEKIAKKEGQVTKARTALQSAEADVLKANEERDKAKRVLDERVEDLAASKLQLEEQHKIGSAWPAFMADPNVLAGNDELAQAVSKLAEMQKSVQSMYEKEAEARKTAQVEAGKAALCSSVQVEEVTSVVDDDDIEMAEADIIDLLGPAPQPAEEGVGADDETYTKSVADYKLRTAEAKLVVQRIVATKFAKQRTVRSKG